MAQLSEVNLMLSEHKIYHLDFDAEHLSDTILTVGDPNRVRLISQHFDTIEFAHQHRGFVVHTGYFKNKRLTVISTGIGAPSIDIVMNELDALVNIDFKTREIKPELKSLQIIRLGTTGAIQASIPVGGFIINTHAVDLTGLMLYYNHAMSQEEYQLAHALTEHMQGKIPAIPMTVHAGNQDLVDKFAQIPNSIKGIAVTCDGFYEPQGRQLRLDTSYHHLAHDMGSFQYQSKKLMNMEMETAAIYGLSKALGHRCCSVNMVINNRIRGEFIQSVPEAEDVLIRSSLDVVATL